MRTQRSVLVTMLAILSTTGCGVWPFNKVFHGILEGGSTVTNTSLGITYTIPKGFYQEKYEATIIKSVALWKHQSRDKTGNSLYIDMQQINWPGVADSAAPPADDAKKLALRWARKEELATNIRQSAWVGPNLPGGEYAYDSVNADGKPESCVVAVVGYPGHRVQIEGKYGGRPIYLPEVRDVALSAKPIGPPRT